ncbi:MAG: hypothetical protein ACXV3F_05675 [Frankiaceae bacterium]
MCEDTDSVSDSDGLSLAARVSRRRLLQGAGVLMVGGLAADGGIAYRENWLLSGARSGLPAHQSMAMHVHTSFSEQSGSMNGHLAAAQKYGVDVVWWTDHDFRMSGHGYRQTVHFTSLDEEQPAKGQGSPWQWRQVVTGRNSSASTGGVVAAPASPKDPVSTGGLHVLAENDGRPRASFGFSAASEPNESNRGRS